MSAVWGLAAVAGVGAAFIVGSRFVTPHARYTVLRRISPNVEVRSYDEHHVAETVVAETDMRAAGNKGFRSLAGFIFGGTTDGSKIIMTTPVAFERKEGEGYVVRFFLPPQNGNAPPLPLDSRVHVRSVPAAHFAARRLPISIDALNSARFDAASADLVRDAAAAGLHVVGAPVQLSYDPPWTPFLWRRNEVIVQVAMD